MKNMPNKSTVVIIGGGPAGAFAGALLAQKGIEVVLLEKEKFPRYKVGESIIPHVWKFMDMVGVSERIEAANFIKKGGGAALWDGQLRAVYFNKHGYDRPGMHVERAVFDDILLQRSRELGVQVLEEMQVTKVDIQSDHNIIYFKNEITKEKGQIEAEFIIDASGQNALIAKQEGLREWDDSFKFQAFWAYYDKSDYLNSKGEITDFEQRFKINPMSLASSTGNWGWVWHLVMRDKVSVGAVIPRSELAKFKKGGQSLEEKFQNHINQTPLTASLLKKSSLNSQVRTIRDYAYQPKQLVFQNCYLTGDAAAFADPINSEGVTMSLYGGFLVAYAIEKSLKKRRRKTFYSQLYETTLRKRFDLFKVLSYPSQTIPKPLLESVKNIIVNQSRAENYLIAEHLLVTNRAKDFPDLMSALGIPPKEAYCDLPLPTGVTFSQK